MIYAIISQLKYDDIHLMGVCSKAEEYVMLFKKKAKLIKTYDTKNQKPVIKCSICSGEQVAGFKDIHSGQFGEIMLIRNASDLHTFKEQYGISGDIEKIY